MGGVTRDGDVPPIQGVSIDDWVTLGSPLGRSDAQVSGNLQQLGVDVAAGRPSVVQHWTNFYDPADSVSALSRNLAGAENVEVNWRPSGLLDITPAHVKIWTNEKVIKWMTARVGALRAPPKKSRTVEDIVAEWEKEHPKPASNPAAGGSTSATPAPATRSQPNQQAVAKCESDYQEQARQISANTHWNYSGLASWSDGCPTAERAFTACYEQTCKLYRDGGISNSCTEGCRATYRSACTKENLADAAARRDQCVAQGR